MPRRHYLTAKQLKVLRQLLDEQLTEILDRARSMVSEMAEAEQASLADELDQANDEYNRLLKLRLHDREQKVEAKIRKAIERMDEENYGYCDSCGVEIGFERLQARPVAELCIDCKLEFEEYEKRSKAMQRMAGN